MSRALSANPKEVGPPSDYVVITKHWMRRMPAQLAVLQDFVSKYANKDTQRIDDDRDFEAKIQSAIYIRGASQEKSMRETSKRVKQ